MTKIHKIIYFICSLSYLSQSWGMDDPVPENVIQEMQTLPLCPVITYEDFITNLCLNGSTEDGWGEMNVGSFAGWLQQDKNRKALQGKNRNIISSLPFFPVRLNPVIDEANTNLLRADYFLPVLGADNQKCGPTFSLFMKATSISPEQMALLLSVVPESPDHLIKRLLQWQEQWLKMDGDEIVVRDEYIQDDLGDEQEQEIEDARRIRHEKEAYYCLAVYSTGRWLGMAASYGLAYYFGQRDFPFFPDLKSPDFKHDRFIFAFNTFVFCVGFLDRPIDFPATAILSELVYSFLGTSSDPLALLPAISVPISSFFYGKYCASYVDALIGRLPLDWF